MPKFLSQIKFRNNIKCRGPRADSNLVIPFFANMRSRLFFTVSEVEKFQGMGRWLSLSSYDDPYCISPQHSSLEKKNSIGTVLFLHYYDSFRYRYGRCSICFLQLLSQQIITNRDIKDSFNFGWIDRSRKWPLKRISIKVWYSQDIGWRKLVYVSQLYHNMLIYLWDIKVISLTCLRWRVGGVDIGRWNDETEFGRVQLRRKSGLAGVESKRRNGIRLLCRTTHQLT